MTLAELASVAGTVGGVLSVGAFLPQAYRILQRTSQDRSVPMSDIAKEVLDSEPK